MELREVVPLKNAKLRTQQHQLQMASIRFPRALTW